MKDEFLTTNNLGGYSSSTFKSGNTRKYHGLLVVANPNVERKVIVNRLEEKLSFMDKDHFISTNQYSGGVTSPKGYEYLTTTNIDPHPVFEYYVEDKVSIKKEILMPKGKNTVEVKYSFDSNIKSYFSISPLITNRSFHHLRHFDTPYEFKAFIDNSNVNVSISDNEVLLMKAPKSKFINNADVYRNFFYPIEAERGYDCSEDLVKIGEFNFEIPEGKHEISITFEYINNDFKTQAHKASQLKLPPTNGAELEEFHNFLKVRAEDFVIQNSERNSIIAGYHWFEDWGRDTFISFRGLLLTQKKYEIARDMLLSWSKYIKHGLVPNRPGLDEYNSIDATLWYVASIYYYWEKTNDSETIKKLLPVIANILENLIIGTEYGIKTLSNGILMSKTKTHGLTWMDAVIGDRPITPRTGAQVEIQMLWFNALNIYKTFEEEYGNKQSLYYVNLLIKNLSESFNKLFWVEHTQYLADYITTYKKNIQIRPNPVIGMALPFQLLNTKKSIKVLEKIDAELLTPVGLKTLNASDKEYKAEYKGPQVDRDEAYHQGTVWPWPLGLYLKSYLKVHKTDGGYEKEDTNYVNQTLLHFWSEIKRQELNYLPEVFSAETLEPNGCLSQAWNYATLLEVFEELK